MTTPTRCEVKAMAYAVLTFLGFMPHAVIARRPRPRRRKVGGSGTERGGEIAEMETSSSEKESLASMKLKTRPPVPLVAVDKKLKSV